MDMLLNFSAHELQQPVDIILTAGKFSTHNALYFITTRNPDCDGLISKKEYNLIYNSRTAD